LGALSFRSHELRGDDQTEDSEEETDDETCAWARARQFEEQAAADHARDLRGERDKKRKRNG
jgi:hypothetical protein